MEGHNRSAEGQVRLCISAGANSPAAIRELRAALCTAKPTAVASGAFFPVAQEGPKGGRCFARHGGGKQCSFSSGGICTRSVHGGTEFCVSHGGGKRCAVPGCTKSARGRTDCCVRHGGGKRSKYENCGKSAQGSTDFCKAHGGGKRCNWVGERV